ncbi:hypothetical protein SJ05684_c29900 [Sinorhizobium sojae CCBAU 05684]|uniref:Uncharacterized protein n=1 Tax=Sinorhizobium sojae CCBAU 05684 TaxID=716928 RepID=A0A249PEP2_9HYPH|nr:hypothetical protein SJ05684_c29900 [Sinorhizobium sojae CCBAU 05684]
MPRTENPEQFPPKHSASKTDTGSKQSHGRTALQALRYRHETCRAGHAALQRRASF